jgi:acyl carrier protein
MTTTDEKEKIRNQVILLGNANGKNSVTVGEDDVLPATGILDSASIMALILWFEDEFGISTDDEDLTLDNFSTINLMIDYLSRHRRG